MDKFKRRIVVYGLLIGLLALLLTACNVSGVTDTVASESEAAATTALTPDAFAIAIEPIGHWHVLSPKTLLFTVTDMADDTGKTGLDLVVQIARAGSSSVSERSVANEQVKEEGEGIYSLEYTPSSLGAYSLVARFLHEGQEFVSQPVAFEVAKAGEEGIKVEAEGTSYVYQVRYNWDPGHIHANDEEQANLVFEIMRGLPEGDDINWEQPWQNVFNHIVAAENPTVIIESEDGAVSEEIQPVYKGRGVYEAQRLFPVSEVGEGKDYEVRFVFTDPYNGAQVTHAEAYHLHASPPH